MFRSPDEVLEARDAIVQQFRKKEITPEIAIERIRAIEPRSPFGFALESELLVAAGDLDGAEEALWNALEGAPCSVGPLFSLAAIRERRGGDAAAVLPFRLLGLWQIASCDVVPEEVATNFEELGKAARVPEAYRALAERTEAALGDAPWPERVEPFRLLTALQQESSSGLDPDLLRDILDQYDRVAPVFRAALRQWADDEAPPLSDESASLLLAILGERGGPELIDDLFPDDQYPTTPVMWHAQWAVCRLGRRFPAEAFDRYEAIAKGADTTARGLLAEQFFLLPATVPGRKEAILRLLDGFPREDDPEESAYLLLTLSTLVEMLGSPAEGRVVLEKHQRRLDAETRRQLNELMQDEHPFVPNLVAIALDEVGIEEVAVDLALLDSGGDEHDHEHFEDDEEDYDEPAVAEPRPGRNDPCWCGSGKKYKKCHLVEDEEADRAAASNDAAEFARVVNDITETAVGKMNRTDTAAASLLFFDREPGLLDTDEDAQTAFLQWMTLDFRSPSTGRTAIEEYLRRRGGRLPEKDRAFVDALRGARYALWEVQRVEKGRGVEVKDYFGDERVFVNDVSTTRQCVTADCLISYVFSRRDRWEFFADGVLVPRALLPRIAEMVENGSREAKLPPSEYFRSRSHEWRRIVERAGRDLMSGLRVANSEGDEVEFAAAVYEVSDAAAAEAALLAAGMFAQDGPGKVVWLESAEAKTGRVFGSIAIGDGRLRIECNSRKRLAIGRQLVEKHAGELLRHTGDEFKSVNEVKRAALEGGSKEPAPDSGIPPELERELILKMKEQHYATWPDHPLPALGGRTPREAVRSASGRRAVEDLLRDMQNGEDHERLAGKAAFDFTPIRRELGL